MPALAQVPSGVEGSWLGRLVAGQAKLRIVTQTEQSQLRQTNPDALHKASYALELELQASKTPYVVLYSPEAFRAGAVQMPHPARIRAQELGEPMPMVTDPVYQHAPFGHLELDLV